MENLQWFWHIDSNDEIGEYKTLLQITLKEFCVLVKEKELLFMGARSSQMPQELF